MRLYPKSWKLWKLARYGAQKEIVGCFLNCFLRQHASGGDMRAARQQSNYQSESAEEQRNHFLSTFLKELLLQSPFAHKSPCVKELKK